MPSSHLQHAIALYQSGKKEEALRVLAALVRQDPHNESAWLWLSALMDDPEKKIFCLKKAREINPSNTQVEQEIFRLMLASTPPAPTPAAPPAPRPAELAPLPSPQRFADSAPLPALAEKAPAGQAPRRAVQTMMKKPGKRKNTWLAPLLLGGGGLLTVSLIVVVLVFLPMLEGEQMPLALRISPTSTATFTPRPTITPFPSNTPYPTSTIAPSRTPTPTNTPTPTLYPGQIPFLSSMIKLRFRGGGFSCVDHGFSMEGGFYWECVKLDGYAALRAIFVGPDPENVQYLHATSANFLDPQELQTEFYFTKFLEWTLGDIVLDSLPKNADDTLDFSAYNLTLSGPRVCRALEIGQKPPIGLDMTMFPTVEGERDLCFFDETVATPTPLNE